MTETTSKPNGVLYYDGTCRFCVEGIRKFQPILQRIRVDVAPFANGALEPEMKLRWKDGRLLGGADVAFYLARRIWWAAPLGWLEWVPGCRWIARHLYRRIAAMRHCLTPEGTCRI